MTQRRLPAEIYWRRRLGLVAVVIALVWGVLQVTHRSDAGEDEAKVEPTAATTATPTATPTVAPTPEPVDDGLVDVALTTSQKPCDPEKTRLTPTVKPGQLTKGPVDIGLVVSTTETKPCTLMPDDAEAIAVITANDTAIWDSTVCKTSLLTAPVAVSPQWSTMSTVQWTGRGSGANCTSNEGWASPGTYTIQIGTLGGEPGKTTFTLDPRPAAPKTPEAPATPDPAAPTTPAPAPTAPAPAPTTPAPAAPGSDAAAPLPATD